jgi:hypothetical protein
VPEEGADAADLTPRASAVKAATASPSPVAASSSAASKSPAAPAAPAAPDSNVCRCVLALLEGSEFKKHGRTGYPHARVVWLDATGVELGLRWGKPVNGTTIVDRDSWIGLGDITAVEKGMSTVVLRKSGKKAKEGLYWSIVGRARSLDLECTSVEERDFFAGHVANLMAEPGLLQDAMMWLYTNGHWAPPGAAVEGEGEGEGEHQ